MRVILESAAARLKEGEKNSIRQADGIPPAGIVRDGQPWFVLADVCKVLEIANSRSASARLKEDEKGSVRLTDGTSSAGGNPNVTIINEPGFYRLVLRSDKPVADEFQTWVVRDVLPAIRKTGTYTVPTASPTPKGAGAWAEAMFRYGVPSNSHQEGPGPAATPPFGVQPLATHEDVEHVFRSWKPCGVRSGACRISKQPPILGNQVIPVT